MEIFDNGQWLPLVFALLFVVAILAYAVLDGYDLGVGILMRYAQQEEQDIMIASIGPFWDANETWLVLALGILLVAFPQANGLVLETLYLPVCLMLVGLVFRGVSFDLRAKAPQKQRAFWNNAFIGGSFLVAITQGYMLGAYVLGLKGGLWPLLFCLAMGLAVAAAFSMIGATWLIMKTSGDLQKKAMIWTRRSLLLLAGLLAVVLLSLPALNAAFQDVLLYAAVPSIGAGLLAAINLAVRRLEKGGKDKLWLPFLFSVGLFKLGLAGLAYGCYPYIVPEHLKIVEAASAPESLMIILTGALVVLPTLVCYTFFAYKVFHGRADALHYN